MQRKIKKKLRTAQISRSKQIFFEHGLGEQKNGADVNGQQSTVNSQRSMVNGQWSTVNGQRSMVNSQRSTVNGTKRRRDKETKRVRDKETKRRRDEETKRRRDEERKRRREELSLEGCTPAKMEAGAIAPKAQFILMTTG